VTPVKPTALSAFTFGASVTLDDKDWRQLRDGADNPYVAAHGAFVPMVLSGKAAPISLGVNLDRPEELRFSMGIKGFPASTMSRPCMVALTNDEKIQTESALRDFGVYLTRVDRVGVIEVNNLRMWMTTIPNFLFHDFYCSRFFADVRDVPPNIDVKVIDAFGMYRGFFPTPWVSDYTRRMFLGSKLGQQDRLAEMRRTFPSFPTHVVEVASADAYDSHNANMIVTTKYGVSRVQVSGHIFYRVLAHAFGLGCHATYYYTIIERLAQHGSYPFDNNLSTDGIGVYHTHDDYYLALFVLWTVLETDESYLEYCRQGLRALGQVGADTPRDLLIGRVKDIVSTLLELLNDTYDPAVVLVR
jgi:hypothetical protein